MIEVAIPKDIMKYKTTLVGPFTTRQTVCICITGVVEAIYYAIIKSLPFAITMDSAVGLGVFFAIPILLFGIVEPFDMPLEKYLKNVIILGFIAPKVRVYETNNFYSNVIPPAVKKKQKEYTAKELKKHPEYIIYQ